MEALAAPLAGARALAAGALGGLVAGAVAGLGARIAMRVIALLNPHAAGAPTENGERIGEITAFGTFNLIAAGALGGMVFGVGYAVAREWLPGGSVSRGLAYGAWVLAAAATPLIVDGDNVDFVILGDDVASVALLLALPLLYGAVLGPLTHRLAPAGPGLLRGMTVRAAGLLVLAVLAAWGLVRLVDALREILE